MEHREVKAQSGSTRQSGFQLMTGDQTLQAPEADEFWEDDGSTEMRP